MKSTDDTHDTTLNRIEVAARALVDSASGNGSRITVSKSQFDALVDALRAEDTKVPARSMGYGC